jgi:hypothetical protein
MAPSLDKINQHDIVDLLAFIGHQPQKISGHNYWYQSPFPDRNEKTLSFQVDRALNRWRESPKENWSTLVDFGVRYYNCTIHELKEILSGPTLNDLAVPQHAPTRATEAENPIEILKTYPIHSFYLMRYLWEQRISLDVAQQYCVEVQYALSHKSYYAIGFQSDAGGYELRDRYHHYSTQPQSPTHLKHQSKDLAVFPEFFDLLTFGSFINTPAIDLPDLLVLNSAAFFEDALPLMENYRYKHLFLSNTPTGDKLTHIAGNQKNGFIDHRPLYKGYNNLNRWACHFGKAFIRDLNDLQNRAP